MSKVMCLGDLSKVIVLEIKGNPLEGIVPTMN